MLITCNFHFRVIDAIAQDKKGRCEEEDVGPEGRSGSNLGSSLIRQQFSTKIVSEKAIAETERGKSKLRSVTQCDDLEELMSNAVLAGTDFRSQRGEMIIVGSEARQEGERVRAPEGTEVPIPRRPPWRDVASAEELEQNERMAFLDWRRELADMEEVKGYLLTPYEKNLEVWRQLWRVLERARLIVQIVDARNPSSSAAPISRRTCVSWTLRSGASC